MANAGDSSCHINPSACVTMGKSREDSMWLCVRYATSYSTSGDQFPFTYSVMYDEKPKADTSCRLPYFVMQICVSSNISIMLSSFVMSQIFTAYGRN